MATEWIRFTAPGRASKTTYKVKKLDPLAGHIAAENRRGIAWTHLNLALAEMKPGEIGAAVALLSTADRDFAVCGDALGAAWTHHRHTLLLPPASQSGDATANRWLAVHQEFVEIDCTLGRAWTTLELAARFRDPSTTEALLSTAESDFRILDDAHGLAWVKTLRATRSLPPIPLDSSGALAVELPPGTPGKDQLIQDMVKFCEGGGIHGGRVTPFHARDLVVTRPTPEFVSRPRTAARRCHVRITLLDESPSAGATARLLLRVVPERGHPWADRDREPPWLSAVSVPLTQASVEPATALLRPSEQAERGAEFDFTPHRTGLHRIRFTIALDHTGTVLQQVETELDILDNDQIGGHVAPHAVTHRGR